MVEEPGKDFGYSCDDCKHDLLHHVGHGECYKSKHTVRRCKCKVFVGYAPYGDGTLVKMPH